MPLSTPAREIITIIRRHKLSYDYFNAACKDARKHCGLKPPSRGRKLPQLLPDYDLRKYVETIDRSDNLQHQIMIRILMYTGVRVAELTRIRLTDVDAEQGKIFIEQGKGDKDRYVLFPPAFRLPLKAWAAQQKAAGAEYLFESAHRRHYSTRRIEQIVKEYAEAAGIELHVHPHLFRHMLLTFLTKAGVSDAKIQLISGHASKKSLEKYQHLALSDVKGDYVEAAKEMIP